MRTHPSTAMHKAKQLLGLGIDPDTVSDMLAERYLDMTLEDISAAVSAATLTSPDRCSGCIAHNTTCGGNC